MSSTTMPAPLRGLIDDASAFPAGHSPLAEVISDNRRHRKGPYAELLGLLVLPVDAVPTAHRLLGDDRPAVSVVGDPRRFASIIERSELDIRQVEAAVAKRGEDPLPGLRALLDVATALPPDIDIAAEVPLTWGVLGALDVIVEARADGIRVLPKLRTGGLAAELFPTPVELASLICACRDRGLPFRLTAGLDRAIRHNDPETGFAHHGFLNVFAGTVLANEGGEIASVAERLSTTDPVPLIEAVRRRRSVPRPLWQGFAASNVNELFADLVSLSLISSEPEPEIIREVH